MTHFHDKGVGSGRRAGLPRDADRVLQTLRHDAVTALGGVLSGFWSSIEEQVRLADLARHDYMAAQDDRAAVLDLSHRALDLATRFRRRIEQEFDQWLAGCSAAPEQVDTLSLMSEGELEIHLSAQQIIELMDHQFLHPLAALDERMRVLAARLGVKGIAPNPLRPEVPVKAFVQLFEADDLPRGLRSMVFNQFDKRLPAVLSELYSRASSVLDSAAIEKPEPSAPAVVVSSAHEGGAVTGRSAPQEAPTVAWTPDGGVVAPLSESMPHRPEVDGPPIQGALASGLMDVLAAHGQAAADPVTSRQYRDLIREQLHQWRAQRLQADQDAPVGGDVLSMSQMLSATSLLQTDDPSPYARVLAGDDTRQLADVIRNELGRGLRELGLDPETTPLSPEYEDAIDLVGILFESLFDANDLMLQARDIYGRLVVPYLKVALTDDSMFSRRAHPARRLLDAVTEVCDGNAGDTPQDRDLLDQTGRVVDRVVDEYETDQAVFELAADELRERLEQQRRRAEIAERRAAEAIHGRERLQQARANAREIVASRLEGRPLTAAVAFFLDRHWRHHLTRTWLRDGPDSERHLSAIGIGDAMVQVDADAANALGNAVADQLLALQVPLAGCYSSCGLDAEAARDAVSRIIAALAIPDTPRSVHAPEADEEAGEAAEPGLQLAGSEGVPEFDPTIAARMRQIRVGQGLRLIDANGRESAARVAWISPVTRRLLIVNRRGARRMVVSPEELAALVGAGRAEVRSVDAPFDEAMKQVWQHLNAANDSSSEAAIA